MIKYWNTLIYVQCMTDWIFQSHCNYLQMYVDNIIIFSVILKKHLQHLWNMFSELISKNICLSLNKLILKYSSVHFLEQCVDTFNLVTAETKLTIIINFKFSQILTQLKEYIKLMSYLQQYISQYAAIVKLLQLYKTFLNQWMH